MMPKRARDSVDGNANGNDPEASGQNPTEQDGNRERSRIRVFRACDRCKKKKSKCDGLHPCGPCSKHHSNCTYTPTAYSAYIASAASAFKEPVSTDQIKYDVSPETVAYMYGTRMRNAGHSEIPTVEDLLEKNKQLEKMITQLQSGTAESSSWDSNRTFGGRRSNSNRGSSYPPSSANGNDRGEEASSRNSQSRDARDDFENDDNNDIERHLDFTGADPQELFHQLSDMVQSERLQPNLEYLSISKFRYSRRYFHALANVFATSLYSNLPNNSQRLVQLPRVQSYGWNLSGKHYVTQKPIDYKEVEIDPAMVKSLLEYYFEKINPLYVMVHEPVFMKQYEIYLATEEKSQDLYLFTGILHAICAISMRFQEIGDNGQFPAGLEETIFEYAYESVNYFTFQYESAEIVQGWLLITLYLRTCHRQSSAWMALGHAIRLTNAMGLMKDCWTSKTINKYCKLKITRLFWCVFTWDRLLSIDTGRPFALLFNEVTVPLVAEYIDDGWLTKPAYAMIKLALCLNPLSNDVGYGLSAHHLEILNKSLEDWNTKCKRFLGHHDEDDFSKALNGAYDPAIICQLRCQYHSCVTYANTRTLFSLINWKWEDKTSIFRKLVFNTSKDSIRALSHLNECGRLKTAWWLKISTLHEATLSLLILLGSSGSDHRELGKYISRGIELVDMFAADDRFAMAKEVQWALRTLNHLVYLRFRDCQNILKHAGIEHGDQKVNQRHFSSLNKVLQAYGDTQDTSTGINNGISGGLGNSMSNGLGNNNNTSRRSSNNHRANVNVNIHTNANANANANVPGARLGHVLNGDLDSPNSRLSTATGYTSSDQGSNSGAEGFDKFEIESPYSQQRVPTNGNGPVPGFGNYADIGAGLQPGNNVVSEPNTNPESSLAWFEGFSWNEGAPATYMFQQ